MKKTEIMSLLKQAAAAAIRAHAPYSGFRVGAALLAADGQVVRGCNVENASYGLTVCAERTAVLSAAANGHRRFVAMAIVADGRQLPYPCGACRQVLAEFCADEFPIYVARRKAIEEFAALTLGELLPKAFRLEPATRRRRP
jgi:cytidine deaminase